MSETIDVSADGGATWRVLGSIERTRASIPTRLRLADVAYEVASSADGALRYIINGETLTPGEAVDRYL